MLMLLTKGQIITGWSGGGDGIFAYGRTCLLLHTTIETFGNPTKSKLQALKCIFNRTLHPC